MNYFEFLALHHYGQGLMIFTALVAFIFSLRHYGRHRAFRIVPYYLGYFFLQAAIIDFNWYASPRGDRFANSLEQISTFILTIFELCVFSLLILHYITGAARRLAIKLNVILFFMGVVFLYFRSFPQLPTYSLFLLEPIALVLPGVVYFYELFTIVNTKPLKDRPSFWIVSGIMYLSVGSLTSMLSLEFLGRFGDGAFALGNLFYSIFFVLIMRAYKCSPDSRVAAQYVTKKSS